MSVGEWQRVSRAKPCPVCGKGDWCLVARDGSAAICPRVESGRRVGDAGHLHRLADLSARGLTRSRYVPLSGSPAAGDALDFAALAADCAAAVPQGGIELLARGLGVSAESLRRLGVGWDGHAWTFPMRDATGRVCGIRRRLPDGRKLSVRGGREGLFVPADLPDGGLLFVAEGPTDCAALLTLGFACVGRPSCTGGAKLVCSLARGRDVVLAADSDEPGRRGAMNLASVLLFHCQSVRVIVPRGGLKDARAWVQAGAARDDVVGAVAAAEPLRLTIKRTSNRGR